MKWWGLLKKVFPVILIFLVSLVLFYKLFFGLYPFAGNLLVSFFFPWSGGGFAGYDSWTTHKEFIGSDSIRMQLPWKVLAFDQIRKGELPLWNPYSFSGNPLLANYQSGILYPFNVLYLILHPLMAWSALTVLQVFLAMFFMYLLLRKFKLSRSASFLGGLAFVSSSFFIMWIEIDIIGHAYLWLPLVIYLIESILVEGKNYFYPALSLTVALSIFAGYPQTAILVIFYACLYFLFRTWSLSQKGKQIITFSFFLILGFTLAAVQLLPTLELYQQAPLAKGFARWVFDYFLIPYHQLVSFFAPDFFGNPAAGNFWGKDYGDLTPSLGVIPLFFALLPLFWKRKDKLFRFLYLTSLIFLLLAVRSPLSFLVKVIRLPVLSSSNPGRILSLLFFNFSLLAGFGFDSFLAKLTKLAKNRGIKILLGVFFLVYFSLWAFVFLGPRMIPNQAGLVRNLAVTKRNLVLPTISFAAILGIFFVSLCLEKIKLLRRRTYWRKIVNRSLPSVTVLIILGFVFLNLFYSLNKYNPFSPKKYYFPDHPVIEFLKNKAAVPDRFYGIETAHFGDNFATFYQIYVAEGYDALRLGRYAELIAAVDQGEVPAEYLRSDAVFPGQDSANRRKIFNLLGVKYLLDKDDAAKGPWDPQPWKYPEERYKLVWQKEKWKVYENLEAFPRAFLVNDYLVLGDDEEIIKKIFSPDFDLSKMIILEEKIPDLELAKKQPGKATIVAYAPNQVVIKTESEDKALLFLSDSFYPGWQASLDGKQEKIYRADYAFRAVLVPAGEHQVTFSYQPRSFRWGLIISGMTFIGLFLLFLFNYRKTGK
jgi:hypothetical protein